jgi:hypothetical protein
VSHIASAISELEQQKEAIDRALAALRAIGTSGTVRAASSNSAGGSPTKRRLSAEGRQNIIAALNKRWAEKRAAQDGAVAMTKTAPGKKPIKRVLSPQARKKMSEAARKRWATQKKKRAA